MFQSFKVSTLVFYMTLQVSHFKSEGLLKKKLTLLSTASVEAKYPLDISFASLSMNIHWMFIFTSVVTEHHNEIKSDYKS